VIRKAELVQAKFRDDWTRGPIMAFAANRRTIRPGSVKSSFPMTAPQKPRCCLTRWRPSGEPNGWMR